jgi:hypothetical protein
VPPTKEPTPELSLVDLAEASLRPDLRFAGRDRLDAKVTGHFPLDVSERGHDLTSDCWCEPTVEVVPARYAKAASSNETYKHTEEK